MSRHYIIALLLLLTAYSNTAADPTSSSAFDAEQSKVVETMKSMYVALTNDDLAKFHTVAAPGFYAFDGGMRFDGDALMELIKAAHAGGKMYVWRVTKPEVHIGGDVAWITYVNQGSIEDASGAKPMGWLESAVLRKEKGSWRIQFFHSTRMPSHEK